MTTFETTGECWADLDGPDDRPLIWDAIQLGNRMPVPIADISTECWLHACTGQRMGVRCALGMN